MITLQNRMIFCTLFDSNYLDKGLALHQSMLETIKNFKLYIFAFDKKCFDVLSNMRLKNVILIFIEDIMDSNLRQLRKERRIAEFCWTCSPVIIEYVLSKYKEMICTYIDADIYFFASPEDAIQEIIDSQCSVGLVEHHFEKNWEYGDNIFRLGKYCIQFNTFLNTEEGLQVLKDWKENCLNWCYARIEDGKYGDQKYPDKWKQKYSCIHEIQNLGMGVAPWNLHLYSHIEKKERKIWLKYGKQKFYLIFYHFEWMKYLNQTTNCLGLYQFYGKGIRKKLVVLYGKYFETIKEIRKYLGEIYGIEFEHMFINRDDFLGNNYTLKKFCMKDGIFYGLINWKGFWTNNIIDINSLLQKRRKICLYKKKL